ncbi:MAG: hypothetical protein JW818_22730, partial [Pirellulales bacterium]|nr:hypothetical protein [Pirellulales bacterium]
KRILAYSTISQLGFMFLGLGAATILGVTAGMFHLFTHAFFKALLFLAAGSVMHAMGGVIDVRQFGGLRRRLPVTYWTFLAGALALAGIIPLAGFWSKDVILVALHERALGHTAATFYLVLYFVALGAAGLTAFYTFRAFLRTFHGPEKIPAEAGNHAHESPRAMTGPLVVLAVCAVLVGAVFELTHGFADFLHETPSVAFLDTDAAQHLAPEGAPFGELEKQTVSHLAVAVLSQTIVVLGIALAIGLYAGKRKLLNPLTAVMKSLGLYQLSYRKFYFDEIYNGLIVRPLVLIARAFAWLDRWLVDGLVNLVGALPGALGTALRPLQNGLLQFYALVMILGLLVLLASMMMS